MKITFVMPIIHQNGGSRVVATYAHGLLARGHDVTVVSRVPSRPGPRRRMLDLLRGRWETDNPQRTRFFDTLGPRHIQIDRAGPLLPEDLPDADVVVATWWRTAFEIATMPPEKGRRVYFVQHHEVHDHLPWDLSGGSYWLPLEKITISPWIARIMADQYGDADVPVIPNSVDTDLFDAPPRTRRARPRVGMIYATKTFKGTDIGIAAVIEARKQFPDLDFIVFGTDRPDPSMPLPPGTDYRFQPPQPEIPGIYASCDAWLMPSRAEGFGLPLLEAMACRTPVVATRTGAAEEFIADGVEGRLVLPDDAEAFATALGEVLALPDEAWSAMSEAAYARVRSWTWDSAIDAMEAELLRLGGRE